MAAVKPMKKEGLVEEEEVRNIRITLSGRKVADLEKICTTIKQKAVEKKLKTKGPVRMPTKFLRLTTRKTPCGEGSKTWDRFEMRIHKRILDIVCPNSAIQSITQMQLDPGVEVEVTVI